MYAFFIGTQRDHTLKHKQSCRDSDPLVLTEHTAILQLFLLFAVWFIV